MFFFNFPIGNLTLNGFRDVSPPPQEKSQLFVLDRFDFEADGTKDE